MKAINILLILVSMAFASVSMTGCLGKKDANQAVEATAETVEEAGDAAEEAGDAAQEAGDEAAEAVEESAE